MFSRSFLSLGKPSVQSVVSHRSLHLACRSLRRDLGLRLGCCHAIRAPALSAALVRHLSVTAASFQNATTPGPPGGSVPEVTDKSNVDELLAQIPEAPRPVISEVVEAIQTVGASGEPTFESLGLGSYYPTGLLQQWLEFLHVHLDMPWWAAIVTSTVCIRILMLPIVIRMQRYTARMNNAQPQMQYIQTQMSDSRKMGDHMEVMRLTGELYQFMKDKQINPMKNAWLPLLQGPIFMSFYWGLRGMVRLPVESMKEGGLWWFKDLTVPDPYYLLPLLTSTTLFVTLEMGTDMLKVSNMGLLRHVFRAIPIVMFPIIINFEGAILCYWVSANTFSLLQVFILRQPKVRAYFNIPELLKHEPKKVPNKKKKFVQEFKDTWTNFRVAREVGNRELYDENIFQKAGKGPVPKTYEFNPKEPRPLASAILSKKKA